MGGDARNSGEKKLRKKMKVLAQGSATRKVTGQLLDGTPHDNCVGKTRFIGSTSRGTRETVPSDAGGRKGETIEGGRADATLVSFFEPERGNA